MNSLHRLAAYGLLALAGCGTEPSEDPAVTDDGDELDIVAVDTHPVVSDPEASGLLAGEALDQRVIVGKDGRVPITDTSSPPFSSVVLLYSTFPRSAPGTVQMCTGTLISEDAVLTAAHCVHDTQRYGGRATSVTVFPGAYPSGPHQGSLPAAGTSEVKDIYVPDDYDDASGYTYESIKNDYAVLRLKRALGKVAGYREFGTLLDPQGRYVQLFGYHSDLCTPKTSPCKGPFGLYQSEDKVRRVVGRVANHYVDTMGGASGGGLTTDGAEFGRVFAINVAEEERYKYNMALLLTAEIVADIRAHLR